jgi:hypothetical protein
MDDLEKLDAIQPKRPPSRQGRVDALLEHIERKLAQGVTLEQVQETLFPDLTYRTVQTMVRRARVKRDKTVGQESGRAPGSSGKPASPAPRQSGSAKPGGNPVKENAKGTDRVFKENRNSSLNEDDKGYVTDKNGDILEAQDDLIPPPESYEKFNYEQIPDEMEGKRFLKRCRSWREAHFALRMHRHKIPVMSLGEYGEGQQNIYKQYFPSTDRGQ